MHHDSKLSGRAGFFQAGVEPDFAHRDLASKAGVDIEIGQPRPIVIVGFVFEVSVLISYVAGRMRAGIGLAVHHVTVGIVIDGVGQIDVPETFFPGRSRQQVSQDGLGSFGADGPVQGSERPDVLRNSDGIESEQARFTGRRRRSGRVEIHTEIGASVDSCDQPDFPIATRFGPLFKQGRSG